MKKPKSDSITITRKHLFGVIISNTVSGGAIFVCFVNDLWILGSVAVCIWLFSTLATINRK